MSPKTKAENLRLFEEARSLRESARSSLHQKATNTREMRLVAGRSIQIHNKAIKKDPR